MKRANGDTVLGVVIAALSCVMMYIAYTTISATGPAGDPGPRVFPIASSLVVLALSILVIVQSMYKPKHVFRDLAVDPEKRRGLIQMLLVLASLLLFLVMWRLVPFLVAGIIFMLLMCIIFRMKLVYTIVYSVAVPSVLYVIFAILLKVRLNIN